MHQVKDAGLLHEPPSRVGRHCDVAFRSVPESHNLKLSFNVPIRFAAFQENERIGSYYRTLPNGTYFKIRKFDEFGIAAQLASHFRDRVLREVHGTLRHLPVIPGFPTGQEINDRELG